MGLGERLRTLAEALPEGASITLSSEALRSLLQTDADENSTLARDMTVEEVANHLDRSPQTVHRWIRVLRFGAPRGYFPCLLATPSRFIRYAKVVGLRSSAAAAPSSP